MEFRAGLFICLLTAQLGLWCAHGTTVPRRIAALSTDKTLVPPDSTVPSNDLTCNGANGMLFADEALELFPGDIVLVEDSSTLGLEHILQSSLRCNVSVGCSGFKWNVETLAADEVVECRAPCQRLVYSFTGLNGEDLRYITIYYTPKPIHCPVLVPAPCSFSTSGVRLTTCKKPLGPTNTPARKPIAATFVIISPTNDRTRIIRAALRRLKQKASFSNAQINSMSKIVRKVDGTRYRVIFKFKAKYANEI